MLIKITPHPLQEVFKEYNVPQWELAKAIGCSQPYISNILRGIKKPPKLMERKLYKLSKEVITVNSDK